MLIELPPRCYDQILSLAKRQAPISNKTRDWSDETALSSKVLISNTAAYFLKAALSHTLAIMEYCGYMSVLPKHISAALDVFVRVDSREFLINRNVAVDALADDDESVDPTWMAEDDDASIDADYTDEESHGSSSFSDYFQSMNEEEDWGISDKMFCANVLRPILNERFKCDMVFKKGSAGILKNAMFAYLVTEMAREM